uniref:Uncharacterized protein n=1 Tax=Branchiostoma floridae TaxID=7739 RepID=C3ZW82_BRAFL|eukprot:XP_002587202.1 hypothetical protein BRAFLDRAFT_102088 [Branchiostoma floridae]
MTRARQQVTTPSQMQIRLYKCTFGISVPTAAAGPTSFEVLRTKNHTYQGQNFLAIEARLPFDGLSNYNNWCLEYMYLCAGYGLRPTGCGENYVFETGRFFNDYLHQNPLQ